MSKWFYSAWALAVLLAFVLPVAVPYAVWPSDDSRCARYARGALQSAGYVLPRTPLTVNVLDCPDEPAQIPRFRAEVTAHGPYGVALRSYLVGDPVGIRRLDSGGSGLIAGGALVAGAALVSIPFTFFWLRHVLRRRPEPAT